MTPFRSCINTGPWRDVIHENRMYFLSSTMMLLASFLFALVVLSKGETNQRIVGGSTATYGDHPYMCSLQIPSGSGWWHFCGCVIWNNDYVVTAAHCLRQAATNHRVVVGNQNMQVVDTHQNVHYVSSYVRHPGYIEDNTMGYPNDIAVVKLIDPITFNTHVNKANFARSGSFVGESCVLVGWGQLSGDGHVPNELQKVNITKISNTECGNRWGSQLVNDGHICFYERTGLSSCSGDSGGPVHCGQYMTGITSWGLLSCSGSYPSVYSRVSYFYDWLVSHAGSN